MKPKPTPLSLEVVDDLAGGLLRDLTPDAGNPDAVRTTLLRWLDRLDSDGLSQVCMRAVFLTFADCLTPTPLDQAPDGRLAMIAPERTDAA